MQKTMFAILIALAGLTIPTITQANTRGNLRIVVDGIRQQQGQVCVSLFAGSQGFPDRGDRAVRAQCVPVGKERTAVAFQNIAVGNYAIAVYHDRNGNGKLDRNFLGIPREGFGFSRNPVVRTRAPRFNEASVFVAGTETTAQIQLQFF
ncbi:DUF2141 domain-containing protein [Leptolyngbya sp. AN03gr2]|uniref:DUF2141 domain-containing protein n=1 Tax=unclassified Leptolyngbya TaxID=2650499 RepID=UPI003D32187F